MQMHNYQFIMLNKTTTFILLLSFQSLALAHHIDPSDPTQVNTSLKLGMEQQRLDDEQVTSFYLTGKYHISNVQLTAEIGYGRSEITDKKEQRDNFLQIYHRFYNTDKSQGLKSAGWAVDVIIPGSDYEDGLSYGHEVISPGITTAFAVNDSIVEYYPSISYHYARAVDDALKSVLAAKGLDDNIQQLRFDVGISPKWDNPIYLSLTPGVAVATGDSDDRFYLQVLAGVFVHEYSSIELYAQYNADNEANPQRLYGEDNFVRINWEIFFK